MLDRRLLGCLARLRDVGLEAFYGRFGRSDFGRRDAKFGRRALQLGARRRCLHQDVGRRFGCCSLRCLLDLRLDGVDDGRIGMCCLSSREDCMQAGG